MLNKAIANLKISEIIYSSDDEEERVRFIGNLKNGIPSGYGTLIWRNGVTYEGIHFQ